jgi:2-dehydro-3-deoxyphosphogluconate aldolase/(4S)-4-hydroxy-2-oxoglutarate aldolase
MSLGPGPHKRIKTRHRGITYRLRADGSRTYYVYASGRFLAVDGGEKEALSKHHLTGRGRPDLVLVGRVKVPEKNVLERLGRVRIVPMTTVDDADQAEQVARALLRGGLSCIEITFRTEAALEAIERVCATAPEMLVGAGTVLDGEQAQAAASAGANFAVAPGTNADVVDTCRELGLPFFPGVATPSEIERARQVGLGTVKVFPITQLGGVEFLRAVSLTYPDVRFLPSGGIDANALPDYLALSSVLACGGSWLVRPELLRAGRFDEVEKLAREAVMLSSGDGSA